MKSVFYFVFVFCVVYHSSNLVFTLFMAFVLTPDVGFSDFASNTDQH